MDVKITTLAERPELAGALEEMPDTWPAFVLEDLIGWANFPRIAVEFPEFVLVAIDPGGTVVAGLQRAVRPGGARARGTASGRLGPGAVAGVLRPAAPDGA